MDFSDQAWRAKRTNETETLVAEQPNAVHSLRVKEYQIFHLQ
jgi:hypothetical protein